MIGILELKNASIFSFNFALKRPFEFQFGICAPLGLDFNDSVFSTAELFFLKRLLFLLKQTAILEP